MPQDCQESLKPSKATGRPSLIGQSLNKQKKLVTIVFPLPSSVRPSRYSALSLWRELIIDQWRARILMLISTQLHTGSPKSTTSASLSFSSDLRKDITWKCFTMRPSSLGSNFSQIVVLYRAVHRPQPADMAETARLLSQHYPFVCPPFPFPFFHSDVAVARPSVRVRASACPPPDIDLCNCAWCRKWDPFLRTHTRTISWEGIDNKEGRVDMRILPLGRICY